MQSESRSSIRRLFRLTNAVFERTNPGMSLLGHYCFGEYIGCNLGDFVAEFLHLGHWLGLAPLALIFCALLVGERRAERTNDAWYWAVIIVLRTGATNLADFATEDVQLAFGWLFVSLTVLLVLLALVTLHRPE